MSAQEKKQLVLAKMKSENEKRSYNEIMADLELELWTLRYKHPDEVNRKLKNK